MPDIYMSAAAALWLHDEAQEVLKRPQVASGQGGMQSHDASDVRDVIAHINDQYRAAKVLVPDDDDIVICLSSNQQQALKWALGK